MFAFRGAKKTAATENDIDRGGYLYGPRRDVRASGRISFHKKSVCTVQRLFNHSVCARVCGACRRGRDIIMAGQIEYHGAPAAQSSPGVEGTGREEVCFFSPRSGIA